MISPEGLNQRFNPSAVRLLRHVLTSLLTQKLYTSQVLPHRYASLFQRIRILDSTTFQLPDVFASAYQGSGGSSQTTGVKIQLEYDLLNGQFLHVHSGPGKQNDRTYGSTCLQTVQTGDLWIRDLGYFDLKDLHQMDEEGSYYISRLKLNTRIYLRNPDPEYFKNGTVKKQTEYIQLDMEEIMHQLKPGQTYEISDVYIGQYQKLPSRVIIHRLMEEQTRKRWENQALKEKKKGIVMKERSKRYQEKTELSEYKAIYIIKDYFLLLFQAIQKSTQELSKVLIRLFTLLQKNGRKPTVMRKRQSLIYWVLAISIPCVTRKQHSVKK